MLEHKVLYTSDLHGNRKQYELLVEFALQTKPATIIIGGDLAPKKAELSEYLSLQRRFLENDLPALIRPLKHALPDTNVFIILGNDDCSVNADVLDMHPELYQNIHNKRVKLDGDYEIIGYSFVPITPFSIKDFEKFDLTIIGYPTMDYVKRMRDCNFMGVKSTNDSSLMLKHFEFNDEDQYEDSIQKDLSDWLFAQNRDRTVYVFHAPPYNTALDVLRNKEHV